MGGTTEVRRTADTWEMASLICAADAKGNSDQRSAIAPVTKGTATLVPPSVSACPSELKLVMASPGAVKPRLPIELPRFESFIGLPSTIASYDWDDPWMTSNGGTAEGAFIARRGNHNYRPPSGLI